MSYTRANSRTEQEVDDTRRENQLDYEQTAPRARGEFIKANSRLQS